MLKCKICGTEFPAIKERHYIARENNRTGAVVVFSKDEEKIYDAYDCPHVWVADYCTGTEKKF